jgi:type IV pilus assembly protein PilA
MQKLLKNNKGFTLVEVIVVAVIVLILAAVAIPLYQGYITESRRSVSENTAGGIAGALSAAVQAGSIRFAANEPPSFSTATGGVSRSVTETPVQLVLTIRNTSGDTLTTFMLPKGFNADVGMTDVAVWWTGTDATAATATRPTTGDELKTLGTIRFRAP